MVSHLQSTAIALEQSSTELGNNATQAQQRSQQQASQMDQGRFELFQHVAVNLGFFAFDFQADLLAQHHVRMPHQVLGRRDDGNVGEEEDEVPLVAFVLEPSASAKYDIVA